MSNQDKENSSNVNKVNNEYKRPGFFKKIYFSIFKFEKYPEMAAEGVGRALIYLLKIMSIFAIIVAIAITVQLSQNVNNGINYLEKDFPNFSYKDGILTVDSDETVKLEKVEILGKVIVNTKTDNKEEINQYINSISKEEQGIIILKDKFVLKNLVANGEITYNYKDVFDSSGSNITEFNKQNIIDFAKGQEILSFYFSFCVVIFIYAFIMYTVSILMDTLLLSLLGYLTALIAKLKMKFVAIYNMAIYALTLSTILNVIYVVVNMFTGFKITYFQVMYTSVAYIYLAAAIFIIKSEFIKKQAELIKIIKAQSENKEEYEAKENKEEKEKSKKDDKKEDKKEDKKNQDNKKDGEEPEGLNA